MASIGKQEADAPVVNAPVANAVETNVSIANAVKADNNNDEKIALRFPNLKGVIAIPLWMVMSILFLQRALLSGMVETTKKTIVIRYDASREAVLAFFKLKMWFVGKKEDPTSEMSVETINETIKLAHFFQDDTVEEALTEKATEYLEKHFVFKCTCGAKEFNSQPKVYERSYFTFEISKVVKGLVAIGPCYEWKDPHFFSDPECKNPVKVSFKRECPCEKTTFFQKMYLFITENPVFAQWIWENVERSILLRYIDAPKKRQNTLLRQEFSTLPEYVRRNGGTVQSKKEDPVLKELHLRLLQCRCISDYTEAEIVEGKIQQRKEFLHKKAQKEASLQQKKEEDPSERARRLARMYSASK